jgi:hypothetical protein
MADVTVMHFPDFQKPLAMFVDASQNAIGVWYAFKDDTDQWRPFAAYSRTLSPSERNYSATRRELLGLVWGLDRGHQFLWNRHFTVFTDHRALTFLFTHPESIFDPSVKITLAPCVTCADC